MFSKASLLFAGLLIGTAALPAGLASANPLGGTGGIDGRSATVVHTVADNTAAQKKAAALKKKKLQQQQAAAAAQAKAKAEQEKKKEWYEDDRDRGLDIAEKYAPKQIAKVRKENYIAKGDTVSTGEGKKGWQHYMDKYYSR